MVVAVVAAAVHLEQLAAVETSAVKLHPSAVKPRPSDARLRPFVVKLHPSADLAAAAAVEREAVVVVVVGLVVEMQQVELEHAKY